MTLQRHHLQIDFKDESVLFIARCAFYTAGAVTLLTNYIIKGMVTSANDTTRIWVPPPQTGFLPDPNAKPVESTYVAEIARWLATDVRCFQHTRVQALT